MKFNRDDVIWGYTGSSSGKTGNLSRKSKITSRNIHMEHAKTGIKIEGTIPEGRYSKKEMRNLTDKLVEELFIKLEKLVNKR